MLSTWCSCYCVHWFPLSLKYYKTFMWGIIPYTSHYTFASNALLIATVILYRRTNSKFYCRGKHLVVQSCIIHAMDSAFNKRKTLVSIGWRESLGWTAYSKYMIGLPLLSRIAVQYCGNHTLDILWLQRQGSSKNVCFSTSPTAPHDERDPCRISMQTTGCKGGPRPRPQWLAKYFLCGVNYYDSTPMIGEIHAEVRRSVGAGKAARGMLNWTA